MNTTYKMTIAVLVGAVLGAAASQVLHAQAKPPAYMITETTVIDGAALKELLPKLGKTIDAAGGKFLTRGSRIVAFEGEAPKFFSIVMFPNLDAAQAWRDSAALKELNPLVAKAAKVRQFAAEGIAN